MQILGLIIIGIVIGVIARLVLPGRQRIGMGMTILLGIAGALVGGIVASAIGTGDIFELNIIGTIVGIIARLVLPGRQAIGVGMTILLGIAGALVGGIVASAIGEGDIWELNFIGTVVGVVAAAALIGAADAAGLGKGNRRDRLGPGR